MKLCQDSSLGACLWNSSRLLINRKERHEGNTAVALVLAFHFLCFAPLRWNKKWVKIAMTSSHEACRRCWQVTNLLIMFTLNSNDLVISYCQQLKLASGTKEIRKSRTFFFFKIYSLILIWMMMMKYLINIFVTYLSKYFNE